MKLSKLQFKSLSSLVRSKSNKDFGPGMRLAIARLDPKGSNMDMQSMGPDYLRRLLEHLPSGKTAKVTSPILKKVRSKAQTSLAGLRTPHLDPESWPQIYRMQMRLNNSRAGLRDFGAGQIGKLHPKGLSLRTPLRGMHTWTTSDAGDLHIMGPWSDVTSMLGGSGASFNVKMGDMYDGDVNVEFDRMYGAPKGESPDWFEKISAMPLYVTLSQGALFSKTEDEGEVVLNAPGEVVDLFASKVTAIAGAVGPESLGNKVLDGISSAKGFIEDTVIPSYELGREVYDLRQEKKLNKTFVTLTIGIGPMGKNYAVGKERMSAADVLSIARRLR